MRRYAFLLGLTFLIFLLIPDLIYSTTAVLQFRPNIETPWTTVELKLPDEVPNLTSEMIGRKISLSDPKLVALCFCYKYRDISFAYMLVAHRWAAKAIALKDCLKNKFWVCHPSGDWEEVNQYKFNMMITTLKWSDSL